MVGASRGVPAFSEQPFVRSAALRWRTLVSISKPPAKPTADSGSRLSSYSRASEHFQAVAAEETHAQHTSATCPHSLPSVADTARIHADSNAFPNETGNAHPVIERIWLPPLPSLQRVSSAESRSYYSHTSRTSSRSFTTLHFPVQTVLRFPSSRLSSLLVPARTPPHEPQFTSGSSSFFGYSRRYPRRSSQRLRCVLAVMFHPAVAPTTRTCSLSALGMAQSYLRCATTISRLGTRTAISTSTASTGMTNSTATPATPRRCGANELGVVRP